MITRELRKRAWNWLPAFLEVAEVGSIVGASRRLHLTPAAISRTLRLLEAEVGEPLFNRVGRQLVLNTRGASLRDAVKSAVAAVDEGFSRTLADPFLGPFRVASLGVLTDNFVVPALIEMKRDHAGLIPESLNLRTADATAMLSRGEIDVAFYYEELSVDGIVVEKLGATPMSVYCGKTHPLFRKRKLTQAMVLEHPFSIPQVGDTGQVMDGWPTELPRKVGMRITLLRSNLRVCLSGELLTVLPDVTAEVHVGAKALRRLPIEGLPDIEVFAGLPASRLERGAERALIERVRTRLETRPSVGGPRRSKA